MRSANPRYFVLGSSEFLVTVNHKFLLKIFSDRSLEDITNARQPNLKGKALRYRVRMEHYFGAKHQKKQQMLHLDNQQKVYDILKYLFWKLCSQ